MSYFRKTFGKHFGGYFRRYFCPPGVGAPVIFGLLTTSAFSVGFSEGFES